MDEQEQSLNEDLQHFKTEQEKIRNIIGQIGGRDSIKRDWFINIAFIVAIVGLVLFDLFRRVFDIELPLPPLFSLEIGILLISLKIIWMLYKQTKVEHFQFWILSSIEFRLNDLTRRLQKIQDSLKNE